jgi:hypothetical protein
MKNNFFIYGIKASKVWCIGTIILTSFFISACASNHSANSLEDTKQSSTHKTVSLQEFEQYRDNQKKWLLDLHDGMSPEDAMREVFSYLQYSFQYKENGKFFQYFEGKYPTTGVGFGLLFEDGRLTNLLLGKAVWQFHWYRYNYARVRGHLFQYWLPNGLQKGISLIRQNNRLGDNYDDVISAYPQQNVKETGGAADATEAIITALFFAPFLPIALAAIPFVPEEEIAEEYDKTSKSSYEQLRELINKVELGITTDKDLIQLLGTPVYRTKTSLTYKIPNTKFGISERIVIWSESWPTTELHLNMKFQHSRF